MLKLLGSVLLREGFRIILREDYGNDVNAMINGSKVLREISKLSDEWVENSLKFVIMGVKDPLIFFCQCIEKYKIVEKSQKSDLKSFQILKKFDKIPDAPTDEQIASIK